MNAVTVRVGHWPGWPVVGESVSGGWHRRRMAAASLKIGCPEGSHGHGARMQHIQPDRPQADIKAVQRARRRSGTP